MNRLTILSANVIGTTMGFFLSILAAALSNGSSVVVGANSLILTTILLWTAHHSSLQGDPENHRFLNLVGLAFAISSVGMSVAFAMDALNLMAWSFLLGTGLPALTQVTRSLRPTTAIN